MERSATPAGSPATTDPAQIHESAPLVVQDELLFSPAERLVLQALEGADSLTAGQLRAQTGLAQADLAAALESLREKGVVAGLNTVVESYRSRFRGVSLGAE